MAYNPNAIFLSPSTLADFAKCPQLYYYRSVYRTPRGLKIQLINPALALGQAVHDTIEQYIKQPTDIMDKFAFVWSQITGDKGGFTSSQEEADYKARAVQMLDRFYGHPHFRMAEVYKTPSFPKFDLGSDLILTGKLDWLEKSGETYKIIDFKTGKNEEKDDSQQLPIYAVLVSGLVNSTNITACYWYLDKDDNLIDFPLPDLTQTIVYLKQQGETIKLVRQTNSYRCQSGGESCWACRDLKAIADGKGKLVTVDAVGRKQEIYILPKNQSISISNLPF